MRLFLLKFLFLDKVEGVKLVNILSCLIVFLYLSFSMNVSFPIFNGVDFQELEIDLSSSDNSSGNVLNQIYWFFIFFISIKIILKQRFMLFKVLEINYPLILFCFMIFLSFLWSDYTEISFRRSILYLIIVFSILVSITYLYDPLDFFYILYRVGAIALVLNLFIIIYGGGFDVDGYFKGIHGHKNSLGPIAVLSIYSGLYVRFLGRIKIKGVLNFLYICLWFIIIFISSSKTSIALLFLCPILSFIFIFMSNALSISLRFFLFISAAFILCCYFIFFYALDYSIVNFIEYFIDDPTFTGRDVIWLFVWEQFKTEMFLGFGYGSFWGVGLESKNILYGDGFIMLLNQAHNGFLDILINVGIVGAILYLMVVSNFLKQIWTSKFHNAYMGYLFVAILFFTLIHNFTESSISRSYSFVWLIQVSIFIIVSKIILDKNIR